MSLTENGLGVADVARRTTPLHEPPGADKMAGVPDVREDGFFLRSRAGAPQHPAVVATGRLDEVTAPQSAEPKEDRPAVQLAPPRPAQPVPAVTAATVPE